MKWAPLAFACCVGVAASFGCQQQVDDLQADPECPSCVERICKAGHDDEGRFLKHAQALEPGQRAQIVARLESYQGCVDALAWPLAMIDEAYETYGAAFYATSQAYYPDRAKRAIAEIEAKSARQKLAAAYLVKHLDSWKDTVVQEQIEGSFDGQLESEAVFSLFVALASPASIARLTELEPSPERDAALLMRWPIVDAATRERILAPYVSAQWSMQTSGSSQYAQYLALSWKLHVLPEDVPPFLSSIEVSSIRIDGNEAKRGERFARDSFVMDALQSPNVRNALVDLQAWLSTANTYRISAKAKIYGWTTDVDGACLVKAEGCSAEPLFSKNVDLDMMYRVFLGVDTGAPRRSRDKAQNAQTSKNLSLSLCNEASCQLIWTNGKAVNTQSMSVTRGHDFYLRADEEGSPLPIAARLMARVGIGNIWQEVGAFFSFAPQHFTPPMRANIDLGDLCPKLGPCKLEFQLRPSLRMARQDPRIKEYWGDTLELGTATLDIKNLSPAQLWRSLD